MSVLSEADLMCDISSCQKPSSEWIGQNWKDTDDFSLSSSEYTGSGDIILRKQIP